MNVTPSTISESTLIPDLLRNAPHTRSVLDRYGLHGCGGEFGPVESLGFFSKAHDVPLENLLAELRDALRNPHSAKHSNPESKTDLADSIYRPFFKAGIVVVLSLGAVWGAYLLLRIGLQGSFAAVGLHEVNAHGHAQIFGWVGLFVMGFAYQAFPRFKHTHLQYPRLAYLTLGLMVTGILIRSILEPMISINPTFGWVAVFGSVIEIAAIGLFVGIITVTLLRANKPFAPYDYFIFSALFWFIVQAVYETLLLTATLQATDRDRLLNLVAAWQGPMREIQIHGFAMMMILGVSQRFFPNFYGFPTPSTVKSRIALVLLNASIVGEALGLILMRKLGHTWAGLWYGSVLTLAGAVLFLVWDWKLFGPSEETDRSLKFLRTAYIWLFVSLGMVVALPIYQYVLLPAFAPDSVSATIGFSHAYYGANRHAITVGFISLMIVGVAAKVVPTLNGIDVRMLSKLWGPFLLINTGCALRVVGQTLTDFYPAMYPITGVSGLLEVSGLFVWGTQMLAVMRCGKAIQPERYHTIGVPERLRSNPVPVCSTDIVADILDRYPMLLDTFVRAGFTPLSNPLLRNTIARCVTVGTACRRVGVDESEFMQTITQRISEYCNDVESNPTNK